MKTLKRYLITFGIGFVMAFLVAYSKNVFDQTELSKIYHILTDSFCIPAVLITGYGGLVFVSNEGVFDGLTYAMTSFFDIFRKEKKNKYDSFYDYVKSKGNRDTSFGYLLVTGLAFMAIMGIMYLLYLQNI